MLVLYRMGAFVFMIIKDMGAVASDHAYEIISAMGIIWFSSGAIVFSEPNMFLIILQILAFACYYWIYLL